MDHKDKKRKKEKSTAEQSCYRVVDSCGCVVGTYRCEGPGMSNCTYEACC